MTAKKWTDQSVMALLNEARKVGYEAGQAKLKELCEAQGKTPTYIHPIYGMCASMLDLCGYSNFIIEAKGLFYKIAKRLSETNSNRIYCRRAYGGGGSLSIFDMSNRQEFAINKACYDEARKVLENAGINIKYIHTWID